MASVLTLFILFVRYFWAVVHHKLCILMAGIRMNQALRATVFRVSYKRLLLHDMSKFSRSEFWPYAEHFYGNKKNSAEFHQAWLHHVRHNDHHWEHFIKDYPSVCDRISKEPLPDLIIREMPTAAILEMVADNLAASRSYEGYWPRTEQKDGWKWLTHAFEKCRLHPTTRVKLTAFLCALGYARALPQAFDWSTIDNAAVSSDEKWTLRQLQEVGRLTN